jgi:DNA-binding transcriptional regulator LsrR (DeoR family)
MTQESPTKRLIEHEHGRPVEELVRGYHALGWSQGRIASELGVHRITVVRWYKELGLSGKR